jgi:hypothetical protein
MIEIMRKHGAEIGSGKRQAQTQVGNMRLSHPTEELLCMITQNYEGRQDSPIIGIEIKYR